LDGKFLVGFARARFAYRAVARGVQLLGRAIMRIIGHRIWVSMFAAAAALSGILVFPARAAVVIDLTQVGPNVEMSATGTLDLAGLSLFNAGCCVFSPGINYQQPSNYAYITVGSTAGETIDIYSGFTSYPSSLGPGTTGTSPTTGTGQ